MILDYVMSGCTFARMLNKREAFKDIMLQELRHQNQDPNHRLSLLFNALTETGHGDVFKDYRKEASIYVDSGGLQLGIYGSDKYGDIESKKREVYATQGTLGDYAFIFDEIPIEDTNTDSNSTKVNLSMRYFTPELLKEKAITTAHNIKEQIQVFKEIESPTKIYVIAHGNCLDSYAEYVERIFDNLTVDEADYIYGIAPSSASNGTGGEERFDMIYSMKGYNIPEHVKKHVHLLGVGAPSALLPFMVNEKYFSFIEKLSFDSTSHSRKYAFSGELLVRDGVSKSLPKHMSVDHAIPYYQRFYNKYEHYFKQVEINSVRELVENCTHYSPYNVKKQWEFGVDEEKYKVGQSLLPALSAFDFIEDFFKQVDVLTKKYQSKMSFLNENLLTLDDYRKYRRDLMTMFGLKSNKVQVKKERPTVSEWE